MVATLFHGRLANNPSRCFSLNQDGFQATGFSPELVMSVQNRNVITEPLAGTRSRLGTEAEVERLRQELLNDSKEIVEHIISVKEAVDELNIVGSGTRVVVEDLMSVRARGSVQHLASTVVGSLSEGQDAWDVFNVIFPSITTSGIPKRAALEEIQRLEARPRELYSGAVLMLDQTDFEAALVLRTVYQENDRQWVQAGAGVVSQSTSERELTETLEKLGSIAPYVASENKRQV